MELSMEQPLKLIPSLLLERADACGDDTIFRAKDRGIWRAMSWAQLRAVVEEIGSSLLKVGIARGDVVGILSELRTEAAYVDLAILGSGAASVALDPDDDEDRICHILSSSGCRLAFVENEEQLDKVLAVRDRCPALSQIVIFDMKGLRGFGDPSCCSLAEFILSGGGTDWRANVHGIRAEHPAILQYARGTEASLGRVLTHGDLALMAETARNRLSILPQDRRLVVLRLSDITERVWGLYLALVVGCVSHYPEGPDTIVENLREVQPTVLGANAEMFEHLHRLASDRAAAATASQRVLYQWALKAAHSGGFGERIANLFVLPAVRREFGFGRLRHAYVGGQSPSLPTLNWARSLGIDIQRLDDPQAISAQSDQQYRLLVENAYA